MLLLKRSLKVAPARNDTIRLSKQKIPYMCKGFFNLFYKKETKVLRNLNSLISTLFQLLPHCLAFLLIAYQQVQFP
jgi:hypothetical protein